MYDPWPCGLRPGMVMYALELRRTFRHCLAGLLGSTSVEPTSNLQTILQELSRLSMRESTRCGVITLYMQLHTCNI